MTRCYEYYCLIKKAPNRCELGQRGKQYVRRYMAFLEQKGVLFNYSDNDKKCFYEYVDQYGTERKIQVEQEIQQYTTNSEQLCANLRMQTHTETIGSQPITLFKPKLLWK